MKTGNTFIAGLFILGIVVIALAETVYTAPVIAPGQIGRELLGDRISTSGTVQRIHEADEAAFIQLVENPEITVVKFTDQNLSVHEGEPVNIHGTVDLYHGKLEIITERIKPVKNP